jgi:hypothetical protein
VPGFGKTRLCSFACFPLLKHPSLKAWLTKAIQATIGVRGCRVYTVQNRTEMTRAAATLLVHVSGHVLVTVPWKAFLEEMVA